MRKAKAELKEQLMKVSGEGNRPPLLLPPQVSRKVARLEEEVRLLRQQVALKEKEEEEEECGLEKTGTAVCRGKGIGANEEENDDGH